LLLVRGSLRRFRCVLRGILKRFSFDLNRWDFQEVIDERVFVH